MYSTSSLHELKIIHQNYKDIDRQFLIMVSEFVVLDF